MTLTSAAGILSLLEDTSTPELQSFALRKLMSPYDSRTLVGPVAVVDVFWAEIADSIGAMEQLHEDAKFPDRHLAALVTSKVYYHLGEYNDALVYALAAGDQFDVNEKSEYVDTMIAKCIDSYCDKRKAKDSNAPNAAAAAAISPKVMAEQEAIVNKMFERCFADKQWRQALGVAIETRRMDMFKRSILESDTPDAMLSYAFRVAMNLIQNRSYRAELLRCLVDLYMGLKNPDYVQMCQCLIFLDDPLAVANVLENLSQGSPDESLMACQIAFDMYESATQQFLNNVVLAVRRTAPIPSAVSGFKAEDKDGDEEGEMEVDGEGEGEDKAKKETAEEKEDTKKPKKLEDLSEKDQERQKRIEKLTSILSGHKTIYLHLQLLMRNDKTDPLILKGTKDAVRVSICHTATVIANGFMHCGTTHDAFLRDNLDWLARATNWAKLSATASLGVIHRGHESGSLSLMQSYLPKDSANSSGYAEGGGLYALGLIHANHGGEITEYLLKQVKEGGNEQIRHGGCLGLGLAAMGTHRSDVYEQLKFNLYQDDAVTGEAAGLAMGLVELGSKSATAIEDMVAYAQETQHEKILRGLAVGISLTMYGRLQEADVLIESLCNDKDAILRRSGMYTIAMAYCGTGSNDAIRKLLHVAVSDVNDDVRRAAVMGLGFLLFKNPDQCPGVVSLLSESYNPHVRYGAAMALGIACAGTGSKEAIALIEPMTNDPVNYVRQGALVASALILIQHTEITCPKVKEFRALYAKVIGDKHDDVMAKYGAILAQGIIDGGGRNSTISLQSRTGHTNMLAVVGMLVFTQYWYWFPLSHFLGLAFTPSCLIALNENLDMPKVSFKSNAKPSTYGYPAPLEEKKKEAGEKVATAVLSITAKHKKKEAEKKKDKEGDKMDVDEGKDGEDAKDKNGKEKMEVEEEKEKGKESKDKEGKDKKEEDDKDKEKDKEGKDKTEDEKEKPKEEPNFEMLLNPARVMKPQLRVVELGQEDAARYKPLKDITIGGIIVVKNVSGEPCEIVEPVAVKKSGDGKDDDDDGADGDEPEPPEPFTYVEEDEEDDSSS